MFSATEAIVLEVKEALGIRSDYALAKALGVTKATASRWNTGKGGMSDEVALRAATLAKRDPAYYLLRLQLERSDALGVQAVLRPIVRELDQKGKVMIRKMRGAAASILLGTVAVLGLVALPAQRATAQDAPSSHVRSVYYVKFRRWLFRRRRFGLQFTFPRSVTAPAI
jgi:hypothetical protein